MVLGISTVVWGEASGVAGSAGNESSPSPKPPSARRNETCSTVANGRPVLALVSSRVVTTCAPLFAPLSTTCVTRVRLATEALLDRSVKSHAGAHMQKLLPVEVSVDWWPTHRAPTVAHVHGKESS